MSKILRDMKNPPVEEDTDKDKPGTQGDKEEYQRKRKEIAKKFGVESCSALKDEKERKACYSALDAAHVSDDEEDEDDDPVGKNEEVKEAILFGRDYKYDGKVIKISKKTFSKVHKDFKNPTKGKEMMMTYDNKLGTVLVPVEFTEEVEIEEAGISYGGDVEKKDHGMAGKLRQRIAINRHSLETATTPEKKREYQEIIKNAEEKLRNLNNPKKEEVELDEKGTAYPATVDTLRMIVKDKQHQTVMFKSGKALVDLFSASAMVQVYDALKKPAMKKHFEKMIADKAGFMKTQAFAMKMIG